MKHLLVIFLVGLVGCSAAKQDVRTPPREFTEGNFGVTFNHSQNIETEYNPHGGADRVAMFRNGTFIGGLRVLPPFPTADEAQFVESAKEYFVETLNASSVEHRLYENAHRYKFDVFKARLTRDGVEHLTERYMYRRQRIPKDSVQATLDGMFGVFQFEFIAPANDYASIEKDIQVIVDTFRLKEPQTE